MRERTWLLVDKVARRDDSEVEATSIREWNPPDQSFRNQIRNKRIQTWKKSGKIRKRWTQTKNHRVWVRVRSEFLSTQTQRQAIEDTSTWEIAAISQSRSAIIGTTYFNQGEGYSGDTGQKSAMQHLSPRKREERVGGKVHVGNPRKVDSKKGKGRGSDSHPIFVGLAAALRI